MSLNFNSVLIGTDNMEDLVAFYSKVVGKPDMEDAGYVGWQVGDGWFSVGPHSEIKGKNTQPARHLVFFEADDVKGEFERIKEIDGAEVIKEPYKPSNDNYWLATLADPDGNYFQLATPWDASDKP